MKFFVSLTAVPLAFLVSFVLSGCQARPVQPVYNLPALIGKPLDSVTQQLGQPQSQPSDSTQTQSDQTQGVWKRGDVSLSATWKSGSKRVTSWVLSSRDADHAVREEQKVQLLAPGQLKENDPRYSLDYIEDPARPLFYTGVRVTPAPKTHAVTIRVSGSEALLQVGYSVSGQPSEGFLTVAPWFKDFSLPDDAQISVSSQLYKPLKPGPVSMKIEILADGKVVASADSKGEAVQCAFEL